MRTLLVVLSLATAPLGLSGCGEPAPQVVVHSQTLTVGCGTCMFKQVGGRGCYWAAKVGDEIYPMKGTALPTEQELPSHGPEGMCTMERTAVVTGEVLPADPEAPRADPHGHEH